MNQDLKRTSRPRRTAIALAVASAFCVLASGPVGATSISGSVGQSSFAIYDQLSLEGPVLIGPVESVHPNGKTIEVLGTAIRLNSTTQHILPAQYVAVFGSINQAGQVNAQSVKVLDQVYAPGSSLVLYSGKLSGPARQAKQMQIGGVAVDFDLWASSRENGLFVVLGTQAISNAAIDASLIVSFLDASSLDLNGTGLASVDGTRISALGNHSPRAIDGSGATTQAIDGSGAQLSSRAIDGSGATTQAIDGSGAQLSSRAIDGSGATTQAIDGSGAQLSSRAIDGSGASTRAIDGSGAQLSSRAIDGSGATTQAIDGSGAQLSSRAIDGSGASTRAIDGSGAQSSSRAIDGSGATTQAIDGSGAQLSSRAIDGSGATNQAIDGSGAQLSSRAIDGSGASTRAIDGSGAQSSSRAIDGSGATTQAIDGSGAQLSSRGIDGSGAPISALAIDGSGGLRFSVRAIDGSGAQVFRFTSAGLESGGVF